MRNPRFARSGEFGAAILSVWTLTAALVIASLGVAAASRQALPGVPQHVRMVTWHGVPELQWNPVAGAMSYVVERNGRSATSALLAPYYMMQFPRSGQYVVAAYNAVGLGRFSSPIIVNPTTRKAHSGK